LALGEAPRQGGAPGPTHSEREVDCPWPAAAAEIGDWWQVAYQYKEVAGRGWTRGMGSHFIGARLRGGTAGRGGVAHGRGSELCGGHQWCTHTATMGSRSG
jgi:hypothetical protein